MKLERERFSKTCHSSFIIVDNGGHYILYYIKTKFYYNLTKYIIYLSETHDWETVVLCMYLQTTQAPAVIIAAVQQAKWSLSNMV